MDKQSKIDCMQGFRRLAQVQVYNGWRCPRAGTGMFGHTLRAVIVILGSKGRTKGDPRQYSPAPAASSAKIINPTQV